MAEVIRTRMTAAEYRELPETDGIQELLEGEIVMAPAPTVDHQDAVLAIAICLRSLVPSGKVQISPNDVYMDEHNVVQPDVFWAGSEGSGCQLGEDRRWHGAPDLVVEILSPATQARDRGYKFDLYERHGVREYWLVDPEAQFVEVYVLRQDRFVRQGLFGAGSRFASPVLGEQTVDVAVIFEP